MFLSGLLGLQNFNRTIPKTELLPNMTNLNTILLPSRMGRLLDIDIYLERGIVEAKATPILCIQKF